MRPGVPLAPSEVKATAGNADALVSWKAPEDNGRTVIRYTATSSPGSATCETAATSCTVVGLADGTGYTFTVKATNANGTGAASTRSAKVIPPVIRVIPVGAAPEGVSADGIAGLGGELR